MGKQTRIKWKRRTRRMEDLLPLWELRREMEQDCTAAAHQQHATSHGRLACLHAAAGEASSSREWQRAWGDPFLKGLTAIIRLSSLILCTSSDDMALGSQKEHGGWGKACMRALQGGKGEQFACKLLWKLWKNYSNLACVTGAFGIWAPN
eukprot:1150195-Pelagomonas_calceolata.AAC.5